jgi:hypothetical protein
MVSWPLEGFDDAKIAEMSCATLACASGHRFGRLIDYLRSIA